MGELILSLALTVHVGLVSEFNSIHPHVTYEAENVNVGAYLNSESTVSTYVSHTFDLKNDFELEAGLVTGYRAADVLSLIHI